MWSERYDRELKDVFEVQDEIARKIAEALRVTLSPQEQEALAGKTKVEARLTKEQRMVKLRETDAEPQMHPRRTPRPGKPLKR